MNMIPAKKHGRSCPCKRLPLALSSFTAAEYGDLHSLLVRGAKEGGISSLASRQDSAGNTPLHLAAQHGHVAVLSVLLDSGECNVNAAAGGATPLHRASFSGAVSAIRLLLDNLACDILARDMSFGDGQTALHKASSGGRYLAIQLLLDTLRRRSIQSNHPTLFEAALSTLDSFGRTPLDVAHEKQQNQIEERRSVIRWDSVAGGVADWDKCVQLLETAQSVQYPQRRTSEVTQSLPSILPQLQSGAAYCRDANCFDTGNGHCVTDIWERAFRAALLDSFNATVRPSTTKNDSDDYSAAAMHGPSIATKHKENNRSDVTSCTSMVAPTLMVAEATPPSTLGCVCSECGKLSIALYPRDDYLVCKRCRRRRPNVVVRQR